MARDQASSGGKGPRSLEDPAEVLAFDQLHHDEAIRPVAPILVDAADVRVSDLPSELDLRAEASCHVAGPGDVESKHLQRHHLFEVAVVRLVDEPHSPPAEETEDLVA